MILFDVPALEVIEQLATTRDQYQQSASRIIVFLVDLKMLGQLIDPLRQQRDLDLRRACVRIVRAVISN